MRFAEFVTPQRFAELFPLAATDLPYACRQLCEPIRASAHEVSRNPRARAALLHVLQKEERPVGPCEDFGVLGMRPRPLGQQFRKPDPLPFHGSALRQDPDQESKNTLATCEKNYSLGPAIQQVLLPVWWKWRPS